jgi:hypothetical protein
MIHSTFQHPPPSPHPHTVCTMYIYTIQCTFSLGRGGGGRRSERRYSRGATVHKYISFFHGGNRFTSWVENLLNRMPQSLLTGQLKEKPTYRVWCLYSSFVHVMRYSYILVISEKQRKSFFCNGVSIRHREKPIEHIGCTSTRLIL